MLDGKLYAVGGSNGDDGILNSVERYDPAQDAWEAVAPMAVRRIAVGVAVLDGKLYAVGGFGAGALRSVERYDPALDAWEVVAPMAAARCHLAVVVLDGKLYAVGGQDASFNARSSVERSTLHWMHGRRWRRWRRLGAISLWRCSTASSMLWAASTMTPSARLSDTTPRRTRGRRLRR